MSLFKDGDHASRFEGGCACGRHAGPAEHEADAERRSARALEVAALKALFPSGRERRRFLRAVGVPSALAALSAVLPMGALQAMAQEKGPLEKKKLSIGFIPITCATPLIMSSPLGFYEKQGLEVSLVKTAGWALIRDKVMNAEYDASHLLAPMPLAMSLGVGSGAMAMNVATIQNSNGQAITLALKHKDNRDPKNWKGFRFAVPFEFSMHNFLLRYYLAEHGLDPDKDVQIRVVPPPEMVANLRAGNLDGYLGPDPFNQRAVYDQVGFIHLLTKELWDGHPCCSFGTRAEWVKQHPNTFAALYRAVLNAAAMAASPGNRTTIANAIAPANYLNQPVPVLEQVLTGRYADGLGNVKNDPGRIAFDPVPWNALGVWILTQMKRWGYVKGDVRYRDIVERVYLMTDARKRMREEGIAAPADMPRKIVVMGKPFDLSKPEAYVSGFAIKRA